MNSIWICTWMVKFYSTNIKKGGFWIKNISLDFRTILLDARTLCCRHSPPNSQFAFLYSRQCLQSKIKINKQNEKFSNMVHNISENNSFWTSEHLLTSLKVLWGRYFKDDENALLPLRRQLPKIKQQMPIKKVIKNLSTVYLPTS